MSTVSIVMPAYNREAYLAKTIDSILGQSYKDFELIIVDDGSTDDSKLIYDYYTKKDERVKVLYVEHGGISKARMAGVELAQGDFICVMDSDDLMVKDRLKRSLKSIEGYDFVYSPYGIVSNDEIQVVDTPKKITFEDVKRNGAWPHVTLMAKKECFKDAYRPDFTANDDAWLVWQWFKRGYKGRRITRPMVLVTLHGGNVSKVRAKEIDRTQKIMDKEYESFGNN